MKIQKKLFNNSLRLIFTFFFLTILSIAFAQSVSKLYVSVSGNDSNSGTTSTNALRTFQKAQEIVRGINTSMTKDITIYFMEGTYFLNTPCIFNTNDSGTNGFKIKYSANGNDKVIISGGINISAKTWEFDPISEIWKCDLSDLGLTEIRNLYINNKRATRARTSNLDYEIKLNSTSQLYIKSDILDDNLDIENIEAIIHWKWKSNRSKIDRCESGKIFLDSIYSNIHQFSLPSSHRAGKVKWFENSINFLDEPGEFYFDGIHLFYKPLNNEVFNSIGNNVIIPNLDQLILLDGESGDNMVHDISFEGLTFSHTKSNLFTDLGFLQLWQGNVYIDKQNFNWKSTRQLESAIKMKYTKNINISANRFIYLGGTGIDVRNGSKEISITENNFEDISSSAITIGDMFFNSEMNVDPIEITERITIKQNIITDIAKDYHGSCAIFVLYARNNIISNNTISDLPYTGISVGWGWDCNIYNSLGNNIIEKNTISQVLNVLSDGAGIYTLGFNSTKTIIRDNFIYNIDKKSNNDLGPRVPIYLDGGSNFIDVIDNYGYNTPHHNNEFVFKHSSCDTLIVRKQNVFGKYSKWKRVDDYAPPHPIAREVYNAIPYAPRQHVDMGTRFVDLDDDGDDDCIWYRYINSSHSDKGARINNGNGWDITDINGFIPPFHISADGIGDMGARFVDVDADNKKDFIFHRYLNPNYVQKGAWLNTGTRWQYSSISSFRPPHHIVADPHGDMGARFVDVDQDGDEDFIFHRYINSNNVQKVVYLNTGNGWLYSSNNSFQAPYHIVSDAYGDMGVRFVDMNGDGYKDFIFSRKTKGNDYHKGCWLSSPSGWIYSANVKLRLPIPIIDDNIGDGDMGVRFIDLDGDGDEDCIWSREDVNKNIERGTYINTFFGWVESTEVALWLPIPVVKHGENLGVRFVDLNDDGYKDIVYSRKLYNGRIVKGAYLQRDIPQLKIQELDIQPSDIFAKSLKLRSKSTEIKMKPSLNQSISYPNPVLNNLYINQEGNYYVKIMSITGKTIIERNMFNKGTLDLSKVKSGSYILLISTFNENYKQIIIKQ